MTFNYVADRPRAEVLLRRLCLGAQVDGIRFGSIPQLLITSHAPHKPVQGQVFLNLASIWTVFSTRPEVFPIGEASIDEPEGIEAFRKLCEIREAVIVAAELAADAPDLLLTFEDGRVFYLNGRHAQYEAWQFGIAFRPDVGVLIAACPGNEVAVWEMPEVQSIAHAV